MWALSSHLNFLSRGYDLVPTIATIEDVNNGSFKTTLWENLAQTTIGAVKNSANSPCTSISDCQIVDGFGPTHTETDDLSLAYKYTFFHSLKFREILFSLQFVCESVCLSMMVYLCARTSVEKNPAKLIVLIEEQETFRERRHLHVCDLWPWGVTLAFRQGQESWCH